MYREASSEVYSGLKSLNSVHSKTSLFKEVLLYVCGILENNIH
jgi:hypothetical protein